MNPLKLLYLDDEPQNLQVFKSAFKQDFEIQTFSDPDLALKAIETESFELVLVDQRMPRMTGVEFLEELNKRNHLAVRILLTGYSDVQALMDAINKGKVFYYATKPWKRDELKLVLLKAVDHFLLVKRNRDLIVKLNHTVSELEIFLYRASHDLKSPITSQLGLLRLLKMELGSGAHDYIQRMEILIGKLERLIEKMNQLSINGYKFVETNMKFDVSTALEKIIAKHKEKIMTENIHISQYLQPIDNFYFDPDAGSVILENIIENAIQYLVPERPGEIRIESSYTNQNSLNLTFTDNGSGIESDILDKAFLPFFKGTTRSDGNGLGLYVVKKLCDELDCSISIKSDGRSWTRVEVQLPNTNKLSV